MTETGLYQLIRLCKSLKEIQLKGTSVSILPKDIVNYDVALDGCPLISPERDIFSKGGFKLLRGELLYLYKMQGRKGCLIYVVKPVNPKI